MDRVFIVFSNNVVGGLPLLFYFEQAENGVYAREALLALVLNENLS